MSQGYPPLPPPVPPPKPVLPFIPERAYRRPARGKPLLWGMLAATVIWGAVFVGIFAMAVQGGDHRGMDPKENVITALVGCLILPTPPYVLLMLLLGSLWLYKQD